MKRKNAVDVHGWINFYKEENISSTKASSCIRKLLNARKAGHAGTLDPFASGVLPIAFGEATKLIPYLMQDRKTYQFTVKFGETTDSLDTDGTMIKQCKKIPNLQEIINILPQFTGKIQQEPPHYSAIKIDGVRAYKKIRNGEVFSMPMREVTIYALQCLKKIDTHHFLFECECASGTYIRSLARDIALMCGSLATVTSLKRIKCGVFEEKDSFSLEKSTFLYHKDQVHVFLQPLTTLLNGISVVYVDGFISERLRLGHKIPYADFENSKSLENISECSDFMACFEQKPIAIAYLENGYVKVRRGFNLQPSLYRGKDHPI